METRDSLTNVPKYSFGYNSAGRLISITDLSGLVTTIERNASTDVPTAIVAPNGQRTTLAVNSDGYLTDVNGPGALHHGFTYRTGSQAGLMASYTNPQGNISTFTYDELGRIIGESMPGGCSWTLNRHAGPSTSDPTAGVQVTLTSQEGRTRDFQVGKNSIRTELRSNVDSAGLVSTEEKPQTAVDKLTTPDGTITTVMKGPDPRFGMQAPIATTTTVRTPGAKVMTINQARTVAVAGDNTLTSQVDTTTINGKVSSSTYNTAAKTMTSVSPMGRTTVTTLDDKGRAVGMQSGNLAPSAYSYDSRGRLSSVTLGTAPDTRVTTFGYDESDRLKTVTDPLNRVTEYTYDDANRVTAQKFSDGNSVDFGYDANGNVTSVTPPSRPAHAFSFTPNDLMSSYTPPVLSSEAPTTYEYNRDKQPTVIHRPDGSQIVFTYDSAGRLATTTYPSVGGNVVVTRTYDPTKGQLTGVTTSDGQSLAYGYDGKLVTSTTWSGTVAGSVSRTYNNDFRVASESVNGANSVAFAYDNDGLLTSVDGLSITRDPTNAFITDTTLSQVTDHRTYDNYGKLATYEAKFGTTSLYSTVYVRDSLGRIEQKTETIQGTTTVWNYSYDWAGRLWQVMQNGVLTATYGYDPNGNRNRVATMNGTQTATYDAQDRLLTYGNWSYTYTVNGDLQTKTDTSNGQVTGYTYDAQGNLRHVGLPDGRAIDYVIDSENRRVAKKVNGSVVRKWIYEDQLKPAAEFDGAGTLLARYLDGVTIRSGISYRVMSDHLGTPRLLVNSATGAVAQRLDLDEWGQVTADTSVGFQVFGFAGGIFDPDTGLVRFGARDYDPAVGRWTAKDPIRFEGADPNLYRYVVADPVNLVDLSGTEGAGPGERPPGPGDAPSPGDDSPGCYASKGPPVNLNACLNACAAGGPVLINFCNRLSHPGLRAACYGLAFAKEVACRGWCFWNF
jgi:RHS repeat-associated protein